MDTMRRTMAVCAGVLAGLFAGVSALHAQSAPSPAPPMNARSVEPRVPRLGIAPCVVTLFEDIDTGYFGEPMFEPEFEYAPPAGCPGPWAKVILQLDMTGLGTTAVANTMIGLGDARRSETWSTELMVAAPQINVGAQRWRVERDITEYQALLRDARPGFARDSDYYFRDPVWGNGMRASARMIFYPATAAQPAPDVPDQIFPLPRRGGTTEGLPRNIERVYLDLYSQLTDFWFSCVPADAAADYPLLVDTSLAMFDNERTNEPDFHGCAGSAYRDVMVRIDGVEAGVAPLYPWLNSDLNTRFERSVDVPVPTPQSIHLIPYRIDLTPFAALLSDGQPHEVRIEYLRAEGPIAAFFDSAQLLVYQDEASAQVSGGVVRNTLAGSVVQETVVRNDWTTPTQVLHGDVERLYRRQFEIAGYVNTSRGRIDTTVTQEQLLSNTQRVTLSPYYQYEAHEYAQTLDFASVTERTSTRQIGARVLAFDRVRHHFPLRIVYAARGGVSPLGSDAYLERASATVEQGHHQQRSHYRPGGAYADRVYANFAGSRRFDALTGVSTNWSGARSHYFNDNIGSCSRERVTWTNEAPTAHTQGVGCPDGVNRVRGFARPDGSPDDLGWLR